MHDVSTALVRLADKSTRVTLQTLQLLQAQGTELLASLFNPVLLPKHDKES